MRKKQAKKRPLLPDPKFNDKLVTRFVNMMMWSGKKSVAFRIFYDAIDIVGSKKSDDENAENNVDEEVYYYQLTSAFDLILAINLVNTRIE